MGQDETGCIRRASWDLSPLDRFQREDDNPDADSGRRILVQARSGSEVRTERCRESAAHASRHGRAGGFELGAHKLTFSGPTSAQFTPNPSTLTAIPALPPRSAFALPRSISDAR